MLFSQQGCNILLQGCNVDSESTFLLFSAFCIYYMMEGNQHPIMARDIFSDDQLQRPYIIEAMHSYTFPM